MKRIETFKDMSLAKATKLCNDFIQENNLENFTVQHSSYTGSYLNGSHYSVNVILLTYTVPLKERTDLVGSSYIDMRYPTLAELEQRIIEEGYGNDDVKNKEYHYSYSCGRIKGLYMFLLEDYKKLLVELESLSCTKMPKDE